MTTKNTIIDFSNHIHTTTFLKGEEGEEIRIDKFAKEGTMINGMKFINYNGGMTVIGDFGSYTFRNNFIPSKDISFGMDYFSEKAFLANNEQGIMEFSRKRLEENIKDSLNYFLDNETTENEIKEINEYFDTLSNSESLEDFNCKIMNTNIPDGFDYEIIPECKDYNIQFKIIFEAFVEMCKRS